MYRLFQACLGLAIVVALASCNRQSGASAASPAPSAGAVKTAAGKPCNMQCLDDKAYITEKAGLAPNSPEAKILAPIAAQIARVVEPFYGSTFHFYVTSQPEPNAYSYYGPRVYISQGMIDFADSREELAGVLCHESSHVLHHDGMRSMRANDVGTARANAIVARAETLTHHHFGQKIQTFAKWYNNMTQLRYTRGQEEAADKSGAYVCSLARSNPWGMVSLLKKIHKDPRMRSKSWGIWNSDHPSETARIAALEMELRNDAVFQIWPEDMAPTPLHTKRH